METLFTHLDRLLLNDNNTIKREVLYTLLILLSFSFVKLLLYTFKKLKLTSSIVKFFVSFVLTEKKKKETLDDIKQKCKEMKLVELEAQHVLGDALSEAEIVSKLDKAFKIDETEEKLQKTSGSYYNTYNSQHKQFVVEQTKNFIYTNYFHFTSSQGSLHLNNELISWMKNLMKAGPSVVGTVTSGGTESIFQSILALREYGKKRGITKPEMIINTTMHVAFKKAFYYLGVKMVELPIDYRTGLTSLSDYKRAINKNTIAIGMSAVNYPHGTIDPIEEMNEYLKDTDIFIIVDSCLGGFTTSISHHLNDGRFPITDFRLERVAAITIDPHKHGQGPKGCSVVLFKNNEIKSGTIFCCAEWTGGSYASSTVAGSKSSAPLVGCWVSLCKLGLPGLIKNYKAIVGACDYLRTEIGKIDQLEVIGEPKGAAFAFAWKGKKKTEILRLHTALKKMNWYLYGIQKPMSIHISFTMANVGNINEKLVADLKKAIAMIEEDEKLYSGSELATLYGTLVALPDKDFIDDFLKTFMTELDEL